MIALALTIVHPPAVDVAALIILDMGPDLESFFASASSFSLSSLAFSSDFSFSFKYSARFARDSSVTSILLRSSEKKSITSRFADRGGSTSFSEDFIFLQAHLPASTSALPSVAKLSMERSHKALVTGLGTIDRTT